jgi:hypothetical protein
MRGIISARKPTPTRPVPGNISAGHFHGTTQEDARDHVGPKTNADPAGSGKHLGWPFSRHIYRSNRMHAGYPSLGLTYMSAGGEIESSQRRATSSLALSPWR